MWLKSRRSAAPKPAPDLSAIGRVARGLSLSDVKMPALKGPDIRLPEHVKLPDITLPRISMGEIRRRDVQLPDVALPRVSMGEVRRPDVQLPDITVPRLKPGEVSFKDIEFRPLGRGLRKLRNLVRLAVLGLFGLAMWREMSQPESQRQWHGEVLGVPYDFRPPTNARLREAWWNERAGLITPVPWGLGWTINFYRARMLARQNPQLRRGAEHLSLVPEAERAGSTTRDE